LKTTWVNNVKSDRYEGSRLSADIREVDIFDFDDDETTIYVDIVTGAGSGTWYARWRGDQSGNPEYCFRVLGVDSGMLEVTP